VAPGISLSEETAPVVAEICRHVDGLPLAIELTAAQVVVLPPAVLLSRIQARLPLPLSGPRDAPTRLRTIGDAVAWSYDLLTVDEQRLFRRLSVFAGGIALDAAEAVASHGDDENGSTAQLAGSSAFVLDLLASLVEKSLLRQEAWEGEVRFVMLETIRSFAWDQLVASGEADAMRDAHAAWALTLAKSAELAPALPHRERLLRRIELDHPNLLAALEWHERREDYELLLQLSATLGGFWLVHGHFRLGRVWLERALAHGSAGSGAVTGRARIGLGRLLTLFGETARADQLLEDGIAELQPEVDAPLIAFGLIRRAAVANQVGDYDQAERHLIQAHGLIYAIDDRTIATTLSGTVEANLGVADQGRGAYDRARARYENALRAFRELGYTQGTNRLLRDLGSVLRDQADFAGSMAHYRESVEFLGEDTDVTVIVDALEGAATAATAWNLPVQAARFLGAAEALRESYVGGFIFMADRIAFERTRSAIRELLDGERLQATWEAGRRLSVAESLTELRALTPPEQTAHPVEAAAGLLTRREREVLQLVVAGQPDREIADTLFLSVRTVEAHVGRILIKLGVRSRTAAVAAAIAAGYFEFPSTGNDVRS
jgi:non-specific serine/threonine protein kinase